MPNPETSPHRNPHSMPENIITGIDQIIMTKVGNYLGEHPEQTVENKREAF